MVAKVQHIYMKGVDAAYWHSCLDLHAGAERQWHKRPPNLNLWFVG